MHILTDKSILNSQMAFVLCNFYANFTDVIDPISLDQVGIAVELHVRFCFRNVCIL